MKALNFIVLDGIELSQEDVRCVLKAASNEGHVLSREILLEACAMEVSKRNLVPQVWLDAIEKLIKNEPARKRYLELLLNDYEKEELSVLSTKKLADMYSEACGDWMVKVSTATASGGVSVKYIKKAA